MLAVSIPKLTLEDSSKLSNHKCPECSSMLTLDEYYAQGICGECYLRTMGGENE